MTYNGAELQDGGGIARAGGTTSKVPKSASVSCGGQESLKGRVAERKSRGNEGTRPTQNWEWGGASVIRLPQILIKTLF